MLFEAVEGSVVSTSQVKSSPARHGNRPTQRRLGSKPAGSHVTSPRPPPLHADPRTPGQTVPTHNRHVVARNHESLGPLAGHLTVDEWDVIYMISSREAASV